MRRDASPRIKLIGLFLSRVEIILSSFARLSKNTPHLATLRPSPPPHQPLFLHIRQPDLVATSRCVFGASRRRVNVSVPPRLAKLTRLLMTRQLECHLWDEGKKKKNKCSTLISVGAMALIVPRLLRLTLGARCGGLVCFHERPTCVSSASVRPPAFCTLKVAGRL